MKKIDKSILDNFYFKKDKDSKKYDKGLVIVIGGSNIYSGSPALAAFSAFRAGADMVEVVAPKRAANIIAGFSPNLVSIPLEGEYLSEKNLSTLISLTKSGEEVSRGNVSVVIGGGLGRTQETKKVVLDYIKEISLPLVIDADAIYAFEGKTDLLKNNMVLTPHIYEFYILTGKNIKEIPEKERPEVVLEESKKLGVNSPAVSTKVKSR